MKPTTLFIALCVIIAAGAAFFAIGKGGIQGIYSQTSNSMPIQSHRSYFIKSDSRGKSYAVGVPQEYSFSIVDEQGATLKDFQITHTKPMHVIVARKDLAYFQHVHPEYDPASGTFSFSDLTFPAPGPYRIFADFAPAGAQMDSMGMSLGVTLSEDVSVGAPAAYAPQPIGSEERAKSFDGYQVTLRTGGTPSSGAESSLAFDISRGGVPVTDLQEYLGALGHMVVLREGTLDFIHAHPIDSASARQNGTVSFMVSFPAAGKYKIFTQFQRAGTVLTTDFAVTVVQGVASGDSMQGMDHSMMHH